MLSHSFNPDLGGIETHSEIIASEFANAGHEVHLLTWSRSKTPDNDFKFKVVRNPNLKSLLTEHGWAQIVFENNPCMRLAWPRLFYGRPSVLVLHTWISRSNGKIALQDYLKRYWVKMSSSIIACSNAVRLKTERSATVIPNPYDDRLFREIPGIRRFDFIFVGRLVSDKGAHLAIRAIAALVKQSRSKFLNCRLTIVGEGPEKETLQRLVKQLEIQKHVLFRGALRAQELARCLNEHRFILVPSVWEEPFGIVALEGMACGCIPIVSNVGGLPEAVGQGGLQFDSNDIDSLLSAIFEVYENESLQNRLKKAATSHLKTHYQRVIAQQYLDVTKRIFEKYA